MLPKVCGKLEEGAPSHSNLFILLALAGSAVNYGLRGPWAWPTWPQLAGAAYVGVVATMLALALWEAAMRRGRASVVGLISHITPLSSTAVLWILKGADEPFTFWSLTGALCITGGAMLPLLRRRRPATEPIV